MDEKKSILQYGLWDSPIKPVSLARGIGFSDLGWNDDGTLVWLESRGNRGVIVVQPANGQAWRDLNDEFSARSRVGYGGGDFCVGLGQVFFAEAVSGRIYRQPLQAGMAQALTPAFGQAAAPSLSPDGRWLCFVHRYEDQDTLEVVDTQGQHWPQKLVAGEDFYMQPVWHPQGERLAWIAWNHPNMPWDGTYLRLGRLKYTGDALPALSETITIAGDEHTSIFQPLFSPDGGFLAYVSDASGWWQLYLYDLEHGGHRQLTHVQAEHGIPAWIQGRRTFVFSPDGARIYFLRSQAGLISLWQLELATGKEQPVPLDRRYAHLEQICISPDGSRLGLLASGGEVPTRVITCLLSGESQVWRRSVAEDLPAAGYALPEAVHWQADNQDQVYGLFYAPTNPKFASPGKPPLIVLVHGGPTSQRTAGFNNQAQFFTSRGYAVLDVNYRGSSGYGRVYRDKLKENWGVYDVEDAVSGAGALVERGQVDGSRLVIMGGSAGGYTVLRALQEHPGFFKAGICLYGISNQFLLAAETHKFEAHYNDSLIGPLPEAAERYRQRSPIFFADRIVDPLAIFQGEEDTVVPRNQSDELVKSLQRRGIDHIYQVYPGEGHGFRKPETIEHFYQAVEKFLHQYVIYA